METETIPGLDRYYGGKGASGVKQQLINVIPPHKKMVIPFIGSGKMVLAIEKKAEIIGNDLDSRTFGKWKEADKRWITMHNLDFRELFKLLGKWIDSDTFIYADPTYPIEWRQARRPVYKHEMSVADHNDLLQIAGESSAMWLISSYQNEIYDTMLKHWDTHTFPSQTRSGTATEIVYANYKLPPKRLHDYQYIGQNKKKRQHNKKAINNMVSKFNRLGTENPHLQQALLLALKPFYNGNK